jgi:hypothetical protein
MADLDDDLPFRVEVRDDADRHIEEVIALTSDFASACGAYEEAVKRRPRQTHHASAKSPSD